MKAVLIEDAAAMTDLLAAFEKEPILAVDTEFFRETSYYPHLGLVQIASGSQVACIDPLAFDASSALKQLFLNPAIIKVFHACSQDLEVLFHHYGILPAPVHDTQIAQAMLSQSEQIGYARLVEAELGVTLAKTQTRTNWLKRPLSQAQIQYAGDDVHYLHTLYHQILQRLQQANRYHWFEEDCARLSPVMSDDKHNQTTQAFDIDMQQLWRRVKGTQKLTGITLALVQTIAQWREEIAISSDTTRRRVLADDSIIQLAMKPPRSLRDMTILTENRFSFTDEQIDQLLSAIKDSLDTAPEDWPDAGFQVLTSEQKARLKILQKALGQKAESLGISASVLCSRKDLEKLIKGNTQLPVLNGWRRQVAGETLLELLNKRPD